MYSGGGRSAFALIGRSVSAWRFGPEALHGIIEEFVTRAGTELTDAGVKIEHVIRQIEKGTVVITYDAKASTCSIVPADSVEEEPPDDRRQEPV